MTDVLLGTTLPQFTDDPDRFVEGAQRAEALGLDSVWLFDHLWPLSGGKERPIIECWTALGYLAAETSSIRIGTLVTRSSLRHPAVVAKMAATIGEIAPGRVTITIGSGDEMSRDENEAYGIPYYAEDDRVGQLVSTVRCVRECLHEDLVTFEDDYVSLRELPPSPQPDPVPKLWVGGRSDDVLEVAGTVADGWNGWGGGSERFAEDAATVVGYAGPRPIELSWGGLVMLGRDDDAAATKMGERNPKAWIVGGPATVADRLRRFVDGGARHLIVTLPDPWRDGVYELLAEEVKPRLA
ncbi:MAG: LLM class flavin-dependent oxidoreductase [Actinobacteria bacterium]|nr:LLM class flavin-dependent oxidoreductase [Actinomycetota bacterium]